MFDLSWTEILVILVVAIVFIGPKELPQALRAVGRWTAKARTMAREFQNNVDEMVRESELDEVRKQVEQVQNMDIDREINQTIDPKGEIASAMSTPDFSLNAPAPTEAAAAQLPPPTAGGEVAPAAEPQQVAGGEAAPASSDATRPGEGTETRAAPPAPPPPPTAPAISG